MNVKELKELIVGLVAIGKVVAEAAKDGLQLSDAAALVDKYMKDPVFKAKIDEAVKGIELVPGEVADITLQEGIEVVLAGAQELMNALIQLGVVVKKA